MEAARPTLRVLPAPDSGQGRIDALADAWSGADQPDWCVDAGAAISGTCSDKGAVAAMPAAERRAIHLTRQRIRAQAILAAAEPGVDQLRRERARRWAIVIGSAALHLVGFVVLAKAVADLRPKPRPDRHDHLFEAAAIVPIEPAPALPTPSEPVVEEELPAESPQPTPQARRRPKRSHAQVDSKPASPEPSEAAPYEMRGFEFSSDGELPAGEPGGEAWGQPGGQGTGRGSDGSDEQSKPGPAKPDVAPTPRGKVLEPEYPPALERKGIEGSVLVKVWIDEHGHVIKAEVVESSGEEAFDHNALMTAQRQEWNAATQAGEAVASTRRYRVHFRLR